MRETGAILPCRENRLQPAGDQHRHHRRHQRRDQGGADHRRRIGRAGGGAQRHHLGGEDGDAGGVERQEQHHGVAGGALQRVQRVQLFHGADAEGRGGVAETQQIGGDIHHNGAHGGVAGRHIGKQAPQQRGQQPCRGGEQSAGLGHLHQPEEQRHDAHQPEGEGHRALGRLQGGGGEGFHGTNPPAPLGGGGDGEGDGDEGEEDEVHGGPAAVGSIQARLAEAAPSC